jgi:hypothetical protein
VQKLVLVPGLVRPFAGEAVEQSVARLEAVEQALARPDAMATVLSDEDISIVRELFGASFLTPGYYLREWLVVKD